MAAALAEITQAIVFDRKAVLPLSGPTGHGITMSLPCIVGKGGIEQVLDVPLSDEETQLLTQSADALKKALASLEAEQG